MSPISPASMRRFMSMIGRHEPRPHRLHQEAIVLTGDASTISLDCAALSANGFSHSTCLPARSAAIVISQWLAVGRGDVDDVDVGIGEQVVVGAVGARDAEPCRELLGRVLGPRADGHDLGAGRPASSVCSAWVMLAAILTGRSDAPANRPVGCAVGHDTNVTASPSRSRAGSTRSNRARGITVPK